MERFLWIFLAGGLGACTRYATSTWASERFGVAFPYGTWLVNVAGCFLIALVMHVALRVTSFPPTLRLAITTGFLGGLTTYSSFNYETTTMLEAGNLRSALLNVGLTLVACFLSGLLGLFVARRLVGP
jgi:CrcB protein